MAEDIAKRFRIAFPILRLLQYLVPQGLATSLLRRSMRVVKLEEGIAHRRQLVEGVACDWAIPEGSTDEAILIYLHGGGFVMPQTPNHLRMVARIAKEMGVKALLVDYRVAPAHPFPAALEDCRRVFGWVRSQGFSAKQIVLAGDSAGGNLALSLLMMLRKEGEELPAGIASLSAVTDLTPEKPTRVGFRDPILPGRSMDYYRRSYLGSADPHSPLISPLLGDFTDFPPMLIHVGDEEILREDSIRLAERAKGAGVALRFEIFPRMWHVWQLFPGLPEARRSLMEISDFLKNCLEAARAG